MRIAIAQMNATVGDLAGNVARILDFAKRARDGGAQLMVTPELAVCGYPPEDLLLREDFMQSCAEAIADIARRSRGITLVVGHPRIDHSRRYNSASVLHEGRVVRVYDKRSLPNYTVFDEERYFEPACTPCVFSMSELDASDDVPIGGRGRSVPGSDGARFALNICADTWDAEAPRLAREAGARVLLVLNASPYHVHKQEMRQHVMRERADETGLTIVYANMIGGQDELVFDGASFVMDGDGEITQQLPGFEEAVGFVDLDRSDPVPAAITPRLAQEAEIYRALVLGLRDYVDKNGFPGVVLGLSGGIDSALTLAIAVDALGPKRVRAVMMPSQYTAAMSRDDARAQAEAMRVQYTELPIDPLFGEYRSALAHEFAGLPEDTTEENLQSRIRGTLLMALSNKTGAIVLATGNKSELATGYATLYGDMAGGFAVLKDIEKMLVYTLARYRNGVSPVIPPRVLDRPASAELKPGQTDQDTLPPYPIVDAIVEAYVEENLSPAEIMARGYTRADIERVLRLVRSAEYKRRQAPIGVRITSRAFGKDWRFPVTNRFQHRF